MRADERFNAAEFFVDRHLREGRGERPAHRAAGRTVTFAALAAEADRAGATLAALGVDVEQRVLLALADSPAFAAAFWGAVKIGAVAVPVPTQMAAADLAFVLADSRARVAIVDETVAPRLLEARAAAPLLRAVLVVGRAPAGALGWEEARAGAGGPLAPAPTVRDDVMYWGYTSGSTGRPKAAPHTHADFVAAADLVGVGVFGLGPGDVVFSASKMSFAFGLGNSLYFPARVGAASVLMAERPEPEAVLEVITRERPTVFCAVPTLYARLLHVAGAPDLSSLRLCVSSGEPLPLPVFDGWRARFGIELADVVGSTEALHDFIASRPGAIRRGTAGQVVPGFEMRLVDDDGKPVGPGTAGHLLVKGPTTALGYWRRPEQTRATMLGPWLRTGDVFREDADGYLTFEGRADDMLKVGGQWVSPAEIEAHVLAHPAVGEAAVVGRADGDGLTRACAFVVLRPSAAAAAGLDAELRAFLRDRLPGFKVPRWIEIVSELPRTSTGKVQRFRLRERA